MTKRDRFIAELRDEARARGLPFRVETWRGKSRHDLDRRVTTLLSREIACIWVVLFVAHLLGVERAIPFRRRLGAVICCVLLFGVYAGLRQLPE